MGFKAWADFCSFWANIATIIGLPAAVWALWSARDQLKLARRATSASLILPIDEGFRQCWKEYLSADDDGARKYAAGNLFNVIESACAIYGDGLMSGKTGDLLESYLRRILNLINRNDRFAVEIQDLIEHPTTFENIAAFMKKFPLER